MKAIAVALAAIAAGGCMNETSRIGAGTTRLEISVSIRGSESLTRVWTLGCTGKSTLPDPERACRRLSALKDPFAPVPEGVACTQVYGGPQVADVRGTFRGDPVSAKFSRENGCEIARWNRVRFLFPAGG